MVHDNIHTHTNRLNTYGDYFEENTHAHSVKGGNCIMYKPVIKMSTSKQKMAKGQNYHQSIPNSTLLKSHTALFKREHQDHDVDDTVCLQAGTGKRKQKHGKRSWRHEKIVQCLNIPTHNTGDLRDIGEMWGKSSWRIRICKTDEQKKEYYRDDRAENSTKWIYILP